ncbi:MAG: heat shock protein HspQ [Aeoliella sp.]
MFRFAHSTPKFEAGQLVCHLRYGYRGVIVAVDPRCQADENWYLANRTQPDQSQPWYHVLVDGGGGTTYVAESNLELDWSGGPVDHPLVAEFFDGLSDSRYLRNDRVWRGWK